MTRHSISPQLTAFTSYMDCHKMRKTPERYAIYERVLGMPDHFFIDELYKAMESGDYHVSRATIYNTVKLLVDAGLVIRHKFGNSPAQYEHNHEIGRHHHLVCTRCGKIREIVDSEIDRLLDSKQFSNFTPHYAELSIYGLCRSCTRKMRLEEKRNETKQRKTKSNKS